MSKYKRIYTKFKLPFTLLDGSDIVTLTFRNKESLDIFMWKNPNYILIYKSYDHPDSIKVAMRNTYVNNTKKRLKNFTRLQSFNELNIKEWW